MSSETAAPTREEGGGGGGGADTFPNSWYFEKKTPHLHVEGEGGGGGGHIRHW